jgi:hypothetical protein
MNNPQVRGYAHAFARRIAPAAHTGLANAVQSAYLVALARPPSAEELADALEFIKQQAESYRETSEGNGRELALADLCQTLMCLNEFVYVE